MPMWHAWGALDGHTCQSYARPALKVMDGGHALQFLSCGASTSSDHALGQGQYCSTVMPQSAGHAMHAG